MAIWSYLVFALLGGATLPSQFGVSVQLAEWVGGSMRAAAGYVASVLTGGAGRSRNQVP